jgi:uncharacterized caspase-like protein
MDRALRAAGFRTIMRENASKASIEEAAAEFFSSLGPGDTALFFYAGHAVQIQNDNVLIPVDFVNARNIIEARFKSFSLAQIFNYLKEARTGRSIIIIDACRSNPVAQDHQLKAGLSQPQIDLKESYVAFSTDPNNVATDNPNGKNSWFTEALADLVSVPEITLDDVFTRVRLRVQKATEGAQTPWTLSSLTSKFYFHPPKGEVATSDPSMADKWLRDALRHEQRGNWQEAIELMNRILKQQGAEEVQPQARARLPYLVARSEAHTRFEAGQYPGAAEKYEAVLKLEPFDTDAAMEAVNAHLLNSDLPKALAMLRVVRQRGTSAVAARADAMLKELAAVQPEAAEELKRAEQPPPLRELFAGVQFGSPDWAAGRRYKQEAPRLELARWVEKMPLNPIRPVVEQVAVSASESTPAAEPAPENTPTAAPSAETGAGAHTDAPVTLDTLLMHVKFVAGSRDLVREEFGELRLTAAEKQNIAVVLNGKPVAQKLPFTATVPAGKYEIRVVEKGNALSMKEVEVRAGMVAEYSFR